MKFNFENSIRLENDEVVIRPMELTDLENLLPVALADKTLLQFSPKPVYSEELLSGYIGAALEGRRKELRYPFVIYSKVANEYAGSTSFFNISEADDRLEIGYTWIGRQFQGTGLNGQCKQLLLDYAFNILEAHRVEIRTDERNIRSCKAIEKLGARYEGTLREHMVLADGFRRNTVCYSILKHEWKK